jgi:hypothetical protein
MRQLDRSLPMDESVLSRTGQRAGPDRKSLKNMVVSPAFAPSMFVSRGFAPVGGPLACPVPLAIQSSQEAAATIAAAKKYSGRNS